MKLTFGLGDSYGDGNDHDKGGVDGSEKAVTDNEVEGMRYGKRRGRDVVESTICNGDGEAWTRKYTTNTADICGLRAGRRSCPVTCHIHCQAGAQAAGSGFKISEAGPQAVPGRHQSPARLGPATVSGPNRPITK